MQLALRRHLLASTVLIGTSMLGTAAYAQTQTAEAAPADEGTIVVTGSLITNPNLERSTPVNVTTSEEVELRQTNVAEQLLREIPGVVPSVGSAVNNGNGGASYVDLRGLGSFRNIVLLDGNRIAPSGLVGRVDLNNIPLALIERTEVLTGGASTTYGADAVSGVVNFITKQNFSGLEMQASEQITQRGDGNVFRVDTTIGANFDDGRGNAVFSIGYQEADPVYQGSRPFSRFNIDSFTGGASGSGTTVPSRFTGTRPIDPATGLPSVNPATANGGVRQLDPTTGRAVPTFQLFNFNPYNIFQTPFQRYNIFGQAKYEVTDGVEVYTRGLFSKNTVKTIIAPSGVFNSSVTINLNNPFLPAALRNQFCAFNTSTTAGVYTPRFDQATCNAAALATGPTDPRYRTVTTNLGRRTPEVGPRISDFRTTIFDYRLGVRGDITDSIRWDVNGSYGESENIQTLQGYVLTSRVRQALLVNGTAANPVCNDTSNGCVPLNVFGPLGTILPNQVPFITGESTTTIRTSLAQARAVVSGDFGASLPWANDAINFAVGGEYRHYTASQRSDILAKTAGELGGAGGAAPDITGGFDVYEAFGEVVAPIVQDKPFFQNVTLEGGVRYSHYTIDAPNRPKFNTTTWKVQGNWEIVDALKLRGGYSRAVRAPNISELFSPLNTGLTNLADDPCASLNNAGTRTRPAPTPGTNLYNICIAQGATAGNIASIQQPTAGQANVTTGGNLALKPEKSNSYTIGAVLQPSFIPGFSASVDYYHIKITGAITTPTPDDVINNCFGATPLTPPANAATTACTLIRRNPTTGGLDGDPATTGGLFAPLTNQGTLKTDGIDLTMNYNTDLGFGKLALSFAGNWTRSSQFRATPTSDNRECVGLFSVNCSSQSGSIQPEFSWTQRSTLTIENVDLSLLWRHISAVNYEGGVNALYSGPVTGTVVGETFNLGNHTFGHIPAFDYFDLASRIGVGDNLTLTLTVTNLFDKKPPLVGATAGSTSFNSGNTYPSTYDALGRTFKVGARLRF
ncbi:TonB-dependent receptor domain-containing protein [Sphingomonas tabacisoli]|uniref:TonB-dependent receptor domain-containing protein n=1 Tax=Sphingomonas tabacisoli TaxID=2249466 RepID=A0ABW4HZL3_9SPHN